MSAHRAESQDRPLTIEEFERLPEEDAYRVELVRGMVVREPRPAAMHGWVLSRLTTRLGGYVEQHHLGHLFADAGVILSTEPATVRGPDLALVVAKRLPSGPPAEGFLDFAPDLCVEIISPSNTSAEIQEKVLEYLDAGARLIWVLHPALRTVTVYRSREQVRVLAEGAELSGGEVLSGFRAPVVDLFAP